MKLKNTGASFPAQAQDKIDAENARRQKAWQLIGLRLAAIFLVIVLLASECAALIPAQ